MAETTKKLNGTGLSQVWAKIVENFATKAALEAIKVGDVNVIESVSVNGVALEVTEKGVNIVVPTGALANLDEVAMENLTQELQELINGKADKATTLEGYGITDAYTKEETDSAIATAASKVYKFKGSVTFAELPTEGLEEGFVYNVKEAFTTTEGFLEGAGKEYPAGTNVAYTEDGWDVLAGVYDFSDYLLKSELVDITEDEINAICVIPTEE